MQRTQQATKEELLAQAVDIFEEITRPGFNAVPPEWFTLDLTMPQVRAIFLLLQDSPLRMSHLASALGISLSRATGLADQLVAKDLVDRWTDPQDRRCVRCVLTEQGMELGQRLLASRRSRWEQRLAPLSVAELKKVYKAMELVHDAARRTTPEEEPAGATDSTNR